MRLTLVITLLAVTVQPLWAHPRLVRSSPASDSHLTAAPVAVSLTFNETVSAPLSRITISDSANRPVMLAPLSVDAKDPATLVARITGPLRAGRYIVRWQVAGDDGHPVRGEFSFIAAAGSEAAHRGAAGGRVSDISKVRPDQSRHTTDTR